MRAAAPALAALLCCLAPAYCAEAPAGGAQRDEVLRQIDRVIANPADDAAKEGLGRSAGRAAAQEKSSAGSERALLLSGAKKDYDRLTAMQAVRAERVAQWKKKFSKACSLASGAATVRRAVDEYEGLLRSFPVYSDSAGLLAESAANIRGIFFGTIKKTYPYLAEGRVTADANMLAALQFARASDRKGEFGDWQASGVAEGELKRAQKLRSLEELLERRLADMASGLSLFRRKHWAESLKYFDEVLAFDRANEEAQYYRELAKSRTGPERGKR